MDTNGKKWMANLSSFEVPTEEDAKPRWLYSFSIDSCFFLLIEITTAAIMTPIVLRSPERNAIIPAGLLSTIIP
jgi:hypothetical protein